MAVEPQQDGVCRRQTPPHRGARLQAGGGSGGRAVGGRRGRRAAPRLDCAPGHLCIAARVPGAAQTGARVGGPRPFSGRGAQGLAPTVSNALSSFAKGELTQWQLRALLRGRPAGRRRRAHGGAARCACEGQSTEVPPAAGVELGKGGVRRKQVKALNMAPPAMHVCVPPTTDGRRRQVGTPLCECRHCCHCDDQSANSLHGAADTGRTQRKNDERVQVSRYL